MEIKPQELRIGNVVKNSHDEIFIVNEIQQNLLFGMSLDNESAHAARYSVVSGVRLTEGILTSVGFLKVTPTQWTHGESTVERITPMKIDQFSDSLFLDDKYGKSLKCLHELQNFFYAVTGKELAIDNKSI